MIAEMPPEIVAKWAALAELDGWGDDNRRTASIESTVHNSALICASRMAAMNNGVEVDTMELTNSDDFAPRYPWQKKPKKQTTVQTPEQQAATSKRLAGF